MSNSWFTIVCYFSDEAPDEVEEHRNFEDAKEYALAKFNDGQVDRVFVTLEAWMVK